MKNAYPIVLTPDKVGFAVYVPDFDIGTQGEDIADAMDMARDAIALTGIVMEDNGKPIPPASRLKDVHCEENELLTFVDVDFTEYRRENEQLSVKKNCTIPSWLNYEAERAGVNFSAILQNALKAELHITDR